MGRVVGLPPLVPRVEEGLAVVHGQLGPPGHHVVHGDLLLAQRAPARLPAQGAHQPRLLKVVLQPWPRVVLNMERRQLRMPGESARGSGGCEGWSENRGWS